ncbi:MAG: IS1595 family transposase [Planctomycetes bacterium]|nr:IS1595 family transposase [Planctomycetota bacterium]
MVDYPQTARELDALFADDEACRTYLARLRWGNGFLCPACGNDRAWVGARAVRECQRCGHQISVTAGTVFQDTKLPLAVWFRAIGWVTSQKYGASALDVQRVLGLGSYRTAWSWLHTLRRAMVRAGRDALHGTVEVDETLIGGEESGGGGRHIGKKALVAVAVELNGRRLGRVRLRRVPDHSGPALIGFVQDAVTAGSTVVTDGWHSYESLPGQGYQHERRVIRRSSKNASGLLPHVHLVASLLKRWLTGTLQGAVSREHLDYYLDEFTFRFNRRTSRSRGLLFYRLLQNAVSVAPAPYATLVRQTGRGRRPQGGP